ncbi:hypothetical protein GCM10027596_39170 [Nocardioides korecus]
MHRRRGPGRAPAHPQHAPTLARPGLPGHPLLAEEARLVAEEARVAAEGARLVAEEARVAADRGTMGS